MNRRQRAQELRRTIGSSTEPPEYYATDDDDRDDDDDEEGELPYEWCATPEKCRGKGFCASGGCGD